MNFYWKSYKEISIVLAIAALLINLPVNGQVKQRIEGFVTDQSKEQPIPFATVSLHNISDTAIIAGTMSNMEGRFILSQVPEGRYFLRVNFIGFEPRMQMVDCTKGKSYNTGKIPLKEETVQLEETLVVGERIKAKTTTDKTTFFVNKKMNDVSNTGVDILKHIPGVHLDLIHNLSLEGHRNVLILVNGKERDLNFVKQINARKIDKVEIIRAPGSKYDANVSGVLNIILKEKETGFNGHIYAEAPTSESEIYLSPAYSLNYGNRKFNFFTSYDGEITYFDITEENRRKLFDSSKTREFQSILNVRQKNWSHNFHYGMDFFLNERNQFNIYGYYNPYSQEHDGDIEMQVRHEELVTDHALADKEDTDKNYKTFYSLYYKHIFSNPDRELTFDLSYYKLKADNTTHYTYQTATNNSFREVVNRVKPRQNSASLRVDFTSPLAKKVKLDAGLKGKRRVMKDENTSNFEYHENTYAAYVALSYNSSRMSLNAGLRAEGSTTEWEKHACNNLNSLLPHVRINYKINKKQSIQMNYRRTITRPNIYQLNPYVSVIDPFLVQKGNPELQSQIAHQFTIDYTVMPGNNYISTRFFYHRISNTINRLTFKNNSGVLETRPDNMGKMHQYGIQLTGAIKLSKAITFSPFFKLLRSQSQINDRTRQYGITNSEDWSYESGCSATVNFKKNLAASFLFQYNSPRTDIQNTRNCDPLYFLSLEKTYKKNLNIGIRTGIPFTKSFNYFTCKTEGYDFHSHSKGNINISVFPVWLHVRFQFNTGKKVKRIDRERGKTDNTPKKGF
ncbi:MAG: TonB-dependent receptor domain-containing protein [Marinifilaceae bacterium]